MAKVVSLARIASPLLYESKAKELALAAEKHNGNFKMIADEVGLTPNQVQRYYKQYPEFKEVVDNARSAFYQSAVAKLEELISNGNVAALNLYFSRSPWAKSHGWGDKIESEQTVKLSDTEKANYAKEILGTQ